MARFTIRLKNKINNEDIVKKEPEIIVLEDKKEIEIPISKGGKMNYSLYQKDIFSFIKDQVEEMRLGINQPQNLMIRATAGSGKSTTLVKSLDVIPAQLNGKPLYTTMVAFNSDIVEALKLKIPNYIKAATFHSIGFSALRYHFKNVKLNDSKMYNIYMELRNTVYSTQEKETMDALLMPFLKIIGFIKNLCLNPTTENIDHIIDEYDIDIDIDDYTILYNIVRDGLIMSNSSVNIIDFSDMIYLPVILNLNFFRVDICFVDESQDLNTAQLKMLRMMVKNKGFIVMVGDSEQAIYRFRGAETDGMYRMQNELNSKVLPLMETYRCSKKITAFAQNLVPEITAFKDNPEGEVLYIDVDKFYELVKEKDMILCRNTAPLIPHVFHLLSKGLKVAIKGRDLAEGLKKIINKLKVSNMDKFYEELEKWKIHEENKTSKKKASSKAQAIEDKYNCLIAIAEDCNNTNEIINKIDKIFDDSRASIIFSTIHKSKGLEAKRVFLLEPELIPSKYAIKSKALMEEKHLLFVAITRAMTNLYIIGKEIDFSIFNKPIDNSSSI